MRDRIIVRPSSGPSAPSLKYKIRGALSAVNDSGDPISYFYFMDFNTYNIKPYSNQTFYGIALHFLSYGSYTLGDPIYDPGRPTVTGTFTLNAYVVYEEFDQTTINWASKPTEIELVHSIEWTEHSIRVSEETSFFPISRVASGVWLPFHEMNFVDRNERNIYGIAVNIEDTLAPNAKASYSLGETLITFIGSDFRQDPPAP